MTRPTFDRRPDGEPAAIRGVRHEWHACRGCARWYAAPHKELNRGRRVYCSIACCARHAKEASLRVGARNPNWLGGVSKDNMRYRRRQIERHPVEEAARREVYNAKKRGDLIPQPCPCGSTKAHAHHPDYAKPLDVVWLCRPCHDREHGKAA